MAYHNHLQHEMALQHFADQQLGENPSVLRSVISDHLGQPSSSDAADGKDGKDLHRLMLETAAGKPPGGSSGPTWLNSAILRQQSQYADRSFLHLQTASDSAASAGGSQWLSRSVLQRNASDVGGGGSEGVPVSSDSMMAAAAMSQGSADLNGGNRNQAASSGGEMAEGDAAAAAAEQGDVAAAPWQSARYKADILAHPLYEQLLAAHVACLRIATPVDQLPRIDAQLSQSQQVLAKYSILGHGHQLLVGDDKELDQFMVRFKFRPLSTHLFQLFHCLAVAFGCFSNN